MPKGKKTKVAIGCNGFSRRRECHRSRVKRRSQGAGFKEDTKGGLPRGELGLATQCCNACEPLQTVWAGLWSKSTWRHPSWAP